MTTHIDLDPLIDQVIHELSRHPDEQNRQKEILRLQRQIAALGPKANKLLLTLEEHTLARNALDIKVALRVGIRAGRADAQAQDLDDDTTELVRELAMMGLDLRRIQRLRAVAELLKLDLSSADDVFDR